MVKNLNFFSSYSQTNVLEDHMVLTFYVSKNVFEKKNLIYVTKMVVLEQKRCKYSQKPSGVNARLFFIHFYVNKKNGKKTRVVL